MLATDHSSDLDSQRLSNVAVVLWICGYHVVDDVLLANWTGLEGCWRDTISLEGIRE